MGSKALDMLALQRRQCERHLAVLQEEGLRQGSREVHRWSEGRQHQPRRRLQDVPGLPDAKALLVPALQGYECCGHVAMLQQEGLHLWVNIGHWQGCSSWHTKGFGFYSCVPL